MEHRSIATIRNATSAGRSNVPLLSCGRTRKRGAVSKRRTSPWYLTTGEGEDATARKAVSFNSLLGSVSRKRRRDESTGCWIFR